MPSAWDTSANIISQAARELALVSATISDPYASTDANVLQLCALLQGLGQDLLRDHQWSHLQTTHTFNTVNGTAAYALPTDYDRTIDQTHWNRDADRPLVGPTGPQGWQYLQAVSVSSAVGQWFRVFNDQVNIYPTPTSAQTVAFEYVSRYWVKESGQSAPNTDLADAATDTLYFDKRLLVAGLKLAYLEAKGFATAAAQKAYDAALSRAQGGDGAAPVLNLSGNGEGVRLLDWRNAPDTGYGS